MREVELKLHVAPGDLERIASLPAVLAAADGGPVTRRLRTVYFDTPDLRLFATGVALRVRREGDGFIQTVKTVNDGNAGDSAGVAVRREWEWAVAGETPNLSLLDSEGVAALVPADARGALRPIFSTDFRRTAILVRPDALTAIEVALDEGEILAGTRRTPISELELELKSGRVASLFALASLIQKTVPLRIGTDSKGEIGYRLATGRPPRPVLPEPLGLSPVTTVAEAFRHILRHGLRHLLANESCALADGDVEGLHQMRVALRRLRTALALFAPLVGSEDIGRLRGELRWFARRLGPARGWDVLLCNTLGPLAASGKAPEGADALLAQARDARRKPVERAFAAIADPRATAFLLGLGAWLEEGRWYADAPADIRALFDRPMSDLAGSWLTGRLRKARAAGKGLESQDAAGRERLRRQLRKLGYAANFFQGLYPPARAQAFNERLKPLLDALDAEHDAVVARKLLRGLGQDAPDHRAAIDAVLRGLERRGERRRKAMKGLWKAFRDTDAFW
ncbi:CYTH and CHAD domain-containing protein [Azospirillum sp. SYSU D00513]|uniref:CYTH and CHAD domain-containing protein n=1 Tax=Azospirillum sp. SYSU D00513 TaxID=2812561 RepID=UPI001A97461B|nr:CYTH and CHAD domain-containing protein [Azospirillum sp. SYSU D00513]